MSSLLYSVGSLEADARWLYQASPFALWLLVDFIALETMAGIQSMGGELGCLFLPSLCWQWFEETEFLSNSLSSLQLPVLFRSRTLDCFLACSLCSFHNFVNSAFIKLAFLTCFRRGHLFSARSLTHEPSKGRNT